MIKRETGQPLNDLAESSGFLRINEGPVFLVTYVRAPYSDERLSRESRKLTVMIQRETVQPLKDLSESLGSLRINEGPFPGHVHTHPYSDAREGTRGYIVAPPLDPHG